MTTFIAYYRVSTDKQGQSGLGLSAQDEAVTRYVDGVGGDLLASYTEVESGNKRNRPELDAAIKACKRHRATLVIAKLDRLARNVHFISGLIESGVEFVACDNPHANKMMVQMLAVFAEHEREMISRRTKEALKVAQARGVRLGTHGAVLAQQHKRDARAYAETLEPSIASIQAEGITTARGIAQVLNERGIKSRQGGQWHAKSVVRVLARL